MMQAARRQPIPAWGEGSAATPLSADVLEVIAEYACGTVRDACALRQASTCRRRSVDTTLRRLVFETQPELRPGSGSSEARGTLHIHDDSTHLDAVRIALTLDKFPRIARLIVVAFALDGPKDEAHEGDVCGPRPVAACDTPPTDEADDDDDGLAGDNFLSTWASPLHRALDPGAEPSPPHVRALRRCLTSAVLKWRVLTEELCAATFGPSTAEVGGSRWGGVRYLSLAAPDDSPDAVRRLVLALECMGPQLTHLQLDSLPVEVCPVIATCSQLQHFQASYWARPGSSADLCDALIASRAPLEYVHVALGATDALRLLEAVPSIVAATMPNLDIAMLPPAVAGRLRAFNRSAGDPRLPGLRALVFVGAGDEDDGPSPNVKRLCVDPASFARHCADFATSFPNLREFTVGSGLDAFDDETPLHLPLPPTLRTVRIVNPDPALVASVVDGLGRRGRNGLPELAALSVVGRTTAPLTPLVAFAATLTTIFIKVAGSFAAGGGESGPTVAELAQLETALAQLVALTTVTIPALPTARCFLAGRHTQLRKLRIGNVDAPSSAPFAKLAAACPRLVRVESDAHCPAVALPEGWCVGSLDQGLMLVCRYSFRDD